ncbi:hypothetical protein BCR32DRAFT_277908 [Anaeromyces robustus]|uniref:Uncharacterized protein n=1 Tax=Anaeromyces robustus TaxID=1754192 RepID=A0A1Y1XCZ0_9FUNG|nr:hypothetical protein BCR32DRAFT_277908 [Anaeromyces robustus]|eukprot:ORX83587.1 hypothetical protein BCR32DRAFT_277908 [Anaeromyces robustus]
MCSNNKINFSIFNRNNKNNNLIFLKKIQLCLYILDNLKDNNLLLYNINKMLNVNYNIKLFNVNILNFYHYNYYINYDLLKVSNNKEFKELLNNIKCLKHKNLFLFSNNCQIIFNEEYEDDYDSFLEYHDN